MTRRFLALTLLGSTFLTCTTAMGSDPIITDSRILNEERRLAILETKLASLQREATLIEDHRAIERLQQAYGYYVSDGKAADAAALFAESPTASIEYAQQGVYLGRAR